jgi:hypothetical protein
VKSVPEAMMKYRELGWSVIPVGADKKPLLQWLEFQNRIVTQEELFGWYSKYPNCQLGIVTGAISNLVVIDVEAGGDISIYPKTLTVQTGGGGYHLYYQHPGKSFNNANRILELTDIRGDGGFVVAPPSKSYKGGYSWVIENGSEEIELSKLPVFPVELIERLKVLKNEPLAQSNERIPVGMRNDAAAVRTGELVSMQSPEVWETVVWPQLLHWNNTALAEPLAEAELRKVYTSITERRRNELNSKRANELTLKPFTLRDLYAENHPPIEWIADGLIPLGCLGALTGESNSYKSFLTLVLAYAIATGTPFLGHFTTPRGKVLIIDEENNRRIIEKRFRAMGIEANDDIVFLSQQGLQIDREDHHEKILRYVNELKPRLVVMDSLVRLHGRDENSASEIRIVMKGLMQLVAEDRTVLFIHHHKKEQGFSRKVGSSSLRGSTDIFAALDFHLAVERKGEDLIVRMLKLRLKEEHPPFKVHHGIDAQANFTFTFEGDDTSQEEQLREIKESIVETLTGVAEEISKQDILDELGTGVHITTKALKALQEENVIKMRRVKSGKHVFSLVDNRSEHDVTPDADEDVTESATLPEIESNKLSSIPF